MDCAWRNAMNPGRLRGATNPRPLRGVNRLGGEKPPAERDLVTWRWLGRMWRQRRREWTRSRFVDSGAHTRTNPMRGATSFCSLRREGGRSEGDTKTMRDASCCSFERRGGVGSGKPLKARLVTTKVMRDAAKTHELLLPPEMLEASSRSLKVRSTPRELPRGETSVPRHELSSRPEPL
jgi:hypothetical protein